MSVVLVNAFEVPHGQEETFLADWQHAADWMRQQPGFISSRLHQSLDPDAEFRYVNVAEWESADHFRKATASPEFQRRISGMAAGPPGAVPGRHRVAAWRAPTGLRQ